MAIELDISPTEYAGAMLFRHADATITYEAGGVTFVPASLNMNRFQNVIINISDGSEYTISWDSDTDNLLVFDATGAEVAADTVVGAQITGIGR